MFGYTEEELRDLDNAGRISHGQIVALMRIANALEEIAAQGREKTIVVDTLVVHANDGDKNE